MFSVRVRIRVSVRVRSVLASSSVYHHLDMGIMITANKRLCSSKPLTVSFENMVGVRAGFRMSGRVGFIGP